MWGGRPCLMQEFENMREYKTNILNAAVTSLCGNRRYNEDRHFFDASTNVVFAGVMDGHGGGAMAEYASKNFPAWFCEKMMNQWHDDQRIKNLFVEFDDTANKLTGDNYTEESRKMGLWQNSWHYSPGCTNIGVAIVEKDNDMVELVACNIGDSRAIYCAGDGKDIALSRDHVPGDPEERARIEKAGSSVHGSGKETRINGILNLSRAFGDFTLKHKTKVSETETVTAVSACPDIVRVSYNKNDETLEQRFLFIGCDGVFEKWKDSEVMDYIRQCLDAQESGTYVEMRKKYYTSVLTHGEPMTPEITGMIDEIMKPTIEKAAKKWENLHSYDVVSIVQDVVHSAISRGSEDNATCMIVLLGRVECAKNKIPKSDSLEIVHFDDMPALEDYDSTEGEKKETPKDDSGDFDDMPDMPALEDDN